MPKTDQFPRPSALRPTARAVSLIVGALLAGVVLGLTAAAVWVIQSGLPIPRGPLVVFITMVGAIALVAIVAGLRAIRAIDAVNRAAAADRAIVKTTLPQLRACWDQAPLSIMLFEPDDPLVPVKILDCNPRACEMHGYTREELVGQSIDLIEAVPWTHNAPNWIASFCVQPCHEGESQHRRKDGSTFDIEYFTSLLIVDGRKLVLGMDREATARKVAERALRSSEERWQLALAGSDAGAWDWNVAGNTVWFSPRWKGILGYADSEFPNTHEAWLDHVHPDDLPHVQAALEAHLARKTAQYSSEYRMRHQDGRWIWLQARGAALFSATGCALRMLGTHSDIQAQKVIEAELRKAKDAAVSADRAKSEFLATMSHEIRTPMNGVLGFTNLLLDTTLVAEQRDWLLTIRSSGESLLTLINDILDFSKIESGCMEVDPHPMSIRRCLEEVLDLLWSKAREKNLELVHSIEPEVPAWINADSARVRQILLNLVGNAIKFTTRGEVEVRVRLRPFADGGSGPGRLEFSIRDTGEGIPPDRIGRLFRAFSQADSSTTRRFGGTGLGLVISRSLAQLLGGDIALASTSTRGSCFHFTMVCSPVPAPANANADPDAVAPEAILAGRHVLIVDDNETNRDVLTCQLERWGLVCRANSNPARALEYLRTHQDIDLALLDMMMPGMNGVELAAQIHQLPGYERLPLVLLSSVSHEELRAFRPKEHFTLVLTKPVRQSALLDALHTTLVEVHPARPAGVPPVSVPKLNSNLGQQHPLRILVAEDNAVNQKLIGGLLARLGYQPRFAVDGAACVSEMKIGTFDVVLMDCQMPVMDGYEATARIRRGEAGEIHRQVHVIALTASAMVGDREFCIQSGMDEYLTKPIRPSELIRLLESAPTLAG